VNMSPAPKEPTRTGMYQGIWLAILSLPVGFLTVFILAAIGQERVLMFLAPPDRFPWPMTDVLPIYALEGCFLILAALLAMRSRRLQIWTGFVRGSAIVIVLNIFLYAVIGSIHP
jgi:hypothetical protein